MGYGVVGHKYWHTKPFEWAKLCLWQSGKILFSSKIFITDKHVSSGQSLPLWLIRHHIIIISLQEFALDIGMALLLQAIRFDFQQISASHPAKMVAPLNLRGRDTLRLPIRGLHSRTRLLQRSSVLRLTWPPNCHLSLLILWLIQMQLYSTSGRCYA